MQTITEFLSCYYQSEYYPTDLSGASQQCIVKIMGQSSWDNALSCSKEQSFIDVYNEMGYRAQIIRPLTLKTPHIYLDEQYSSLASIDLKKAICRVDVSDRIIVFLIPKLIMHFLLYRRRIFGSANRTTNTSMFVQ